MATKKRRRDGLGSAILRVYREITMSKRSSGEWIWNCVYFGHDDVLRRVAKAMKWKRLSERRKRQITGTVSSLVRRGKLEVRCDHRRHGNRGIGLVSL